MRNGDLLNQPVQEMMFEPAPRTQIMLISPQKQNPSLPMPE